MLTARLADHRARLAQDGIILDGVREYLPADWRNKNRGTSLAMDAQPTLFTAPNAGVPSLFTTYVDPRTIKVVYAPTVAAEFYGEEKIGDWTTTEFKFPLTELSGHVTAYGDFNEGGESNANANWVTRQSHYFQTHTKWGERELAMYGEARVDWASLQTESSANTIARAQNTFQFFGVAGIRCYGGMNDPALPAAISPTTKTAGGTTWAVGTVLEIYNDFVKMYTALQTALPALVNMSSEMDVGIPNTLEPYLAKTNDFGKTVKEIIQQSFPNVRFVVIPQFVTDSGNLIQLKLRSLNALPVTMAQFTEKMRMHPVITMESGWKQKHSAGTAGTTIRYPIAIVQMLGA